MLTKEQLADLGKEKAEECREIQQPIERRAYALGYSDAVAAHLPVWESRLAELEAKVAALEAAPVSHAEDAPSNVGF